MYRIIAKTYHIAQVIFSVAIIILGATYSLRCLLEGNIFCAICFALIGYVSGYLLLFRASVKELRQHNAKMKKS